MRFVKRIFAKFTRKTRYQKSAGKLRTIQLIYQDTTTEEGLTVTAVKDTNSYPTGLKVSDKDMVALNITSNLFHGDWNYTIQPQ